MDWLLVTSGLTWLKFQEVELELHLHPQLNHEAQLLTGQVFGEQIENAMRPVTLHSLRESTSRIDS